MQAQPTVQNLYGPVIVGLDIGNGWTKLVSTLSDPIIFQSLAAPVAAMGDGILGKASDSPIVIDGVAWDAGFLPNATSYPQAIHKGAAFSDAHYALFLEAMHRFEATHIDILVIGLTSDQIGDDQLRKALRSRLVGEHHARGKDVYIDKVGIFEQPIGTARKFIDDNRDRLGDQTLLIVDVGYGTTDVTRIRVSTDDDGVPSARSDFSMSQWLGVSQVCSTASETIKAATGQLVAPVSISRALRRNAKVSKGSDPIDLRPYVEAAVGSAGERLTAAIRHGLRSLDDIDVVIFTGGGASLFSRAIDLGRPSQIMQESELANVRGYVLLGKDHA